MLTSPLPYLGIILIILYSGELIWREHNLKFNGIKGGTPTTNSVFFLAKGIAVFFITNRISYCEHSNSNNFTNK